MNRYISFRTMYSKHDKIRIFSPCTEKKNIFAIFFEFRNPDNFLPFFPQCLITAGGDPYAIAANSLQSP